MSEYSSLYIAEHLIDGFRNSIGYATLLFVEQDEVESDLPYAMEVEPEEEETDQKESGEEDDSPPPHGHSYRSTARALIERLEIMGYTLERAKAEFEEGINALREDYEQHNFVPREKTARLFDGFTFETWSHLMDRILKENLKHAFPKEERTSRLEEENPKLHHMLMRTSIGNHLFGFPSDDHCNTYRAILELVDPDAPVVLDYSALVDWVDQEAYACTPPKVLILTEGSSDKSLLEKSLRLLYPHLFGYYSFMDFEAVSMQGGAGQLLNVVRAFLGTGIDIPIIALFDNDTAGRDALRQLSSVTFPENIEAMQLPDLDMAKSYPTIGPQGEVEMDVNGLACGIELYLGKQALLDESGSLIPVEWAGYNKGMKQYQGEIQRKSEIQDRYYKIVDDVANGRKDISEHDWSGMQTIFKSIFEVFK